MKSIMEEASSIMEAIQKGWERAGKPQEFSVKIFEDSQTSFFGMRTVKSAKVALFFKDGAQQTSSQRAEREPRPTKPARHTQEQRESTKGKARDERPRTQTKDLHLPSVKTERQPISQKTTQEPRQPQEQEKTPAAEWNSEMIDWVKSWIQETLKQAELSDITFTSESSKNLLRIDFSAPLVAQEKQERLLFSTFAHLILSSLRNTFKGDLKRLKIVLNSNK